MTERNLQVVDHTQVDLDAEIRNLRAMSGRNVQPIHRGPNLPEYVDHNPSVDDVGRLSAEALAMSYEKAALEIEELGKTLVGEVKSSEITVLDTVKELERYKEAAKQAVEQCQAAAEAYRKEAKELFALVQARAMAADNARMMCLEMVNKIKAV